MDRGSAAAEGSNWDAGRPIRPYHAVVVLVFIHFSFV